MITYIALNLTSKKFQVGSALNFKQRYKQHREGKGNLEFQRSLRKNPENFYWIVSEDDGLDDRSEEQYYLDFYCGTIWCYNLNPYATAPYYEWTPERREQRSQKMLGQGNPMFGKRGEDSPHYGKPRPPEAIAKTAEKLRGRVVSQETRDRQSQVRQGHLLGVLFWVNKEGAIKRSKTCPGPDWQRGMKWKDTL
jgi:hypothetical protein